MPVTCEGPVDRWFEHESLPKTSNSIRLLRIMPGSEYPIRCKVEHYATAIGTTPPYRCLSYTWGEAEPEESMLIILLNDTLFRVRCNLWYFLRQARSKDMCENLPWWIDALCIDQTSDSEKNHTIQMMGQIYENAVTVVTWLGAFRTCGICTPGARELLQRMLEWRDTVKEPPLRTYKNKRRQIHEFAQLRKLVKAWYPPGNDDLFEELTMVLHVSGNEYWKRAWILQEMKLAATNSLWADHVEIELPQARCLYLWSVETLAHYDSDRMLSPGQHQALVKSPMRNLLDKQNASWEHQALLKVLRDFRHAECEVVHDRIYSVLALSLEGPKLGVDYACSRTSLFFECLWTTKEDFCYCSATFLIERLQLKQNPDEHMARLLDVDKVETAIDTEQPYIEARWEKLAIRFETLPFQCTAPEATALSVPCELIHTCVCSNKAYSPTWGGTPGLILCLGTFGPEIGLRSAVCNIYYGLHLFFTRSKEGYHVSEFANYRSYRKRGERLRLVKPVPGYSLSLDNELGSRSEHADRAYEAVLSMTPSAFVQLVREFGASGEQCFKGNANTRFTLLYNYQPDPADVAA